MARDRCIGALLVAGIVCGSGFLSYAGGIRVTPEGQFILRDLIALGQIGVKVVLASEDAGVVDLALQGECHAQCKLNGALVDDRQHARHTRANRADCHIWLGSGGIDHRASAKHLGARRHLSVNFESNDGFVFHMRE